MIDIIRSEDTLHTFAIVMEKSGLLFETVWSHAQRDRDTFKRFIETVAVSVYQPVVGGVSNHDFLTTAYLTKILVNWVEPTNNHQM